MLLFNLNNDDMNNSIDSTADLILIIFNIWPLKTMF